MVVSQDLQRRTVQTVGSDFAPQRAVQVGRRAASDVVAAPLERGVATEGVAERAQPSEIEPSVEARTRATGQQPFGNRSEIGGLVVTDGRTGAERRLVRALLRTEHPGDRQSIRLDDPAVSEHGNRGLVGVIDADDDLAKACHFLGDGRPHQRREPLGEKSNTGWVERSPDGRSSTRKVDGDGAWFADRSSDST